MPVPQTFTSGALGFATKWSANSMQTFKAPWPAPSPRTAWPSMYAFWLISSLALLNKAFALQRAETTMRAATFMVSWNEFYDEVLTEGR